MKQRFQFVSRLILVAGVVVPYVAHGATVMFANPRAFANGVLSVASIVVSIIFVAAIAVFAWGIVKMIMAAGDPGEVAKARGIIIWGVIALAVLASLYGVVNYLQIIFGVEQTGTLMLPAPKITPGGFVAP